MKRRKICYQEHHPDYNMPDFTIPLRRNHHMYVTRVQQLKPTIGNIQEICNLLLALIYELDAKVIELDSGVESSRSQTRRGL